MPSRGERNNNPGNLEASDWTRQQPGFVGSDGRFAIFDTMASGIAAQVSLLKSYLKRGYDTPAKIINRYGNDPGTADDVSVANYIAYASKRLGVDPNTTLLPSMAAGMAAAMREFETGNTVKGIMNSIPSAGDIASGAGDVAANIGSALTPDWIENLISGKTAARWTSVIIGIILIGLAIAAFVFVSGGDVKKAAIKAVL